MYSTVYDVEVRDQNTGYWILNTRITDDFDIVKSRVLFWTFNDKWYKKTNEVDKRIKARKVAEELFLVQHLQDVRIRERQEVEEAHNRYYTVGIIWQNGKWCND